LDHIFERLADRSAFRRVRQRDLTDQPRIRQIGPAVGFALQAKSCAAVAIENDAVLADDHAEPAAVPIPKRFATVGLRNHIVAKPSGMLLTKATIDKTARGRLFRKLV